MIRWGGIIIAVSFREEKVYRDLRMMMRLRRRGTRFVFFVACVERAVGRTGDAGLEGGGAAHEGGGAGLGRGHLGGDDGLGHGVHSEHGHDLLFCFETVFGGAGGRRGAGSACACDLTGERVWTGRRDRHGVCSRAMSTLDGRHDGSSIPVERAIGHRAALRDPMGDDIFRAAINRSLASSKRAGWLNGGRTHRKATIGGIARHERRAGVYRLTLWVVQRSVRSARVGRAKRSLFRVRVSVFPL